MFALNLYCSFHVILFQRITRRFVIGGSVVFTMKCRPVYLFQDVTSLSEVYATMNTCFVLRCEAIGKVLT
jgi:hypothetical protein